MLAVPDDQIRCVAFLTIDETDEGGTRRVPRATAFFVGVRNGTARTRFDYIVTARHCLEKVGPNRTLFVRFNTVAQGFIEVPTNTDDWFKSDTDDVAAIMAPPGGLPSGLTPADIDGASLSMSSFVGADYWWRGSVDDLGEVQVRPAVGNEVFFTGLFSQHFGVERNLPIVRFGHISRMPSEIELESGGVRFKTVAYLMEFRSWGGHSGSPVFFMYPITIQGTDSWDNGYLTGFMGVVSAHYDIATKAAHTGDILGDIQVALNSGIAVVTPASAVRSLLEREDVVAHRQDLFAKLNGAGPVPTLDFAETDS